MSNNLGSKLNIHVILGEEKQSEEKTVVVKLNKIVIVIVVVSLEHHPENPGKS